MLRWNQSKLSSLCAIILFACSNFLAEDVIAQSEINLVKSAQLLSMTRPSELGCLTAHLEQDAKESDILIAVDDDLVIPIPGGFIASWVPPAPPSPNTTIAGVDSDGDCVRDDIERYITDKYPRKSDYLVRENLFRYAIWLQRFINLPPVIPSIHAKVAITNMRIAEQCVKNILGNEVGGDVLSNLFAQFHNTWPRSDLYVSNMVNYISGWTTRDDPVISCN